jgi:hypothetical protein
MYSKILARFEEIVRFTSEDLTRDLDSTLKNGVTMTDTHVFERMLDRQNKLRAYLFVVGYFSDLLKHNSEVEGLSAADVVALSNTQMFEVITREIVSQSTNARLHDSYKNALVDMYREFNYAVPK